MSFAVGNTPEIPFYLFYFDCILGEELRQPG